MKLFPITLFIALQLSTMNAMDPGYADSTDANSIVHDFLHNHTRFKALWGTPEKSGTNYLKLPKEISQRIAREALAPAVSMLKRNICLLIATRTIPKTFIQEPLSYNSREAWNYFEMHRNDPSECPSAIERHPKTKLAVTISLDHSVSVWNTQTKQCVQTLQGHTAPISRAQFDPAGNLIATASEDKTVKLWDAHTGECISTYRAAFIGSHPHLRFLKAGTALAITASNVVKVYSLKTGRALHTICWNRHGIFHNIAFDSEEPYCIGLHESEKDGRYACLWDVERGNCITQIKSDYCENLDISDNTILIRAGKKHVHLWDVGRYFAARKFLHSINLEQALLLNCLAHTLLTNKILQKKHMHKSEEFKAKLVREFDFNKFPHLQTIFESLPLEIQHGLHESVIMRDEDDGSWCSIA